LFDWLYGNLDYGQHCFIYLVCIMTADIIMWSYLLNLIRLYLLIKLIYKKWGTLRTKWRWKNARM